MLTNGFWIIRIVFESKASPLVTVAVPSFNQGQYLEDTLSSIFEQGIPVEVFVMDGGSTDSSLEIIKRWEPKLSGWRSRQDEGQSAAINEGIGMGSAPYVCWLNSDDFFYPGALARLVTALQDSPSTGMAYGKCWTVNQMGRKTLPYLTTAFSPRLFANFCFIAQPATLINRAAWEKLGGLNTDMVMAFDYDIWWRLFKTFGKPAYCREFVAATRMHEETKTATQLELHYKESSELVRCHWGRIPLKWRVLLPVMKIVRKLQSFHVRSRPA